MSRQNWSKHTIGPNICVLTLLFRTGSGTVVQVLRVLRVLYGLRYRYLGKRKRAANAGLILQWKEVIQECKDFVFYRSID